MFEQQKRDEPEEPRPDGLYQRYERSSRAGTVSRSCAGNELLYEGAMNPLLTGALMLAVGLAATQARAAAGS